MDEREKAKKQLNKSSRIMRDHTLIKLLKGYSYEEDSLAEILESQHIHFKSDHFAVMLYHIDNYNRLFDDNDEQEQSAQLQLVSSLLRIL